MHKPMCNGVKKTRGIETDIQILITNKIQINRKYVVPINMYKKYRHFIVMF